MLNRIRKLLRNDSTSAEIEIALSEIDLDRLAADKSALETQRRESLLSGTDAEVKTIETKLDAARLALDRAGVAREELETRLVAAREREADQELRDRHAALREEVAAISKRIGTDYPKAANAIAEIAKAERALLEKMESFATDVLRHERALDGVAPISTTPLSAALGEGSQRRLWSQLSMPAVGSFGGWTRN